MKKFTFSVNGKKQSYATVEEMRNAIDNMSVNVDENSIKIETIKFTSSIQYDVSSEENPLEDYKKEITSREAYIEVKTNNEDDALMVIESIIAFLKENGYNGSYCYDTDEYTEGKFTSWEYFNVSDKSDYNELKDLYKEWKSNNK